MFKLIFLLGAVLALTCNILAKDIYLLLDIEKEVNKSSSDLKDALAGVNVVLAVKEIGTKRHIMVVGFNSRSREILATASIPGKVVVRPVEDLVDSMKELNISWPARSLLDDNITLYEKIVSLKGLTSQQFQAVNNANAKQIIPLLEFYPYRAFLVTGATPRKTFVFANVPREGVDKSAEGGFDVWGGPGVVSSSTHYMVKF